MSAKIARNIKFFKDRVEFGDEGNELCLYKNSRELVYRDPFRQLGLPSRFLTESECEAAFGLNWKDRVDILETGKDMKEMKKTRATKNSGVKAAVKRVIAERDEVQTRLSKLCAFMDDRFEGCKFLELSPANRILLERQRTVMQEYRDILDVRIELMTGGLPR